MQEHEQRIKIEENWGRYKETRDTEGMGNKPKDQKRRNYV
jgi:hypothetical protein